MFQRLRIATRCSAVPRPRVCGSWSHSPNILSFCRSLRQVRRLVKTWTKHCFERFPWFSGIFLTTRRSSMGEIPASCTCTTSPYRDSCTGMKIKIHFLLIVGWWKFCLSGSCLETQRRTQARTNLQQFWENETFTGWWTYFSHHF